MNEEVINNSKKASSSESEGEVSNEGEPQNMPHIRRPPNYLKDYDYGKLNITLSAWLSEFS